MKSVFLAILILFVQVSFARESEQTLLDALRDYDNVLVKLSRDLGLKKPECSATFEGGGFPPFCSMKDFCEKKEIQKDNPVLYVNESGERVINWRYYHLRSEISSCLREKYADEIGAKKEEIIQQKKAELLRRMMDANKKLSLAMKKNKQGNAVALVSAEILTQSIEAGLKGEDSGWDNLGTSREELLLLIAKAEKKLKINLAPDIKNALIEIQFLKNNPHYMQEGEDFERTIIPQAVAADPFFDWRKLTEVDAAGSAGAMRDNRKKLGEKTQAAYDLFKETKEDLLHYLESRKTKDNAAMIERSKEKIRTITFNPPRLTETLKKVCESPNAFYNSENHTLTLCPQMLNFPKISLIETIAHEMAHSIDSCNLSKKLVSGKGPTVVEDAPFEIPLKTDETAKNYKSPSLFDDTGRGAVIFDLMKYSDHPFSQTLSCLQDPQSVVAVSIDKEKIRKEVEKNLNEKQKNFGINADNNVDARYLTYLRDHFNEYFDYSEGCGLDLAGEKGLYHSELQESFADKIAFEVLAVKLENLPKEKVETNILEVSLNYDRLCPKESNDEKKMTEFAESMGCTEFFKNRQKGVKILRGLELIDPAFEPHPDSIVTIERNLLAHPAIRKALHCPIDKEIKYCE